MSVLSYIYFIVLSFIAIFKWVSFGSSKLIFLSVLTKTWNEPKQPETNQNDPKPVETTQSFKIMAIWIFVLVFVFQILSANAQIWSFWTKQYWLSDLNEFSHIPYFECSDMKFVICFWHKQMTSWWHIAHVWIGRYCTVKEFRIDSRNVWINAMKLIWELQLFRVNNLSVHFYIFFFFFFCCCCCFLAYQCFYKWYHIFYAYFSF